MEYTPVTAVWEVTMGCNMRCDHCGSACAEPLPDELTTKEALQVCDDMKALGLKWITLSGGEPLIRKDWPLLAGRLYRNGIIPNIITNGWLVTEQMVKTAEANGVETISISLDGVKNTHDAIRKKGSYDKVISAFQVLNKMNHVSGANTTITKQNIEELEAIKEILLAHQVDLWQIQIGLPMGNLSKNRGIVIEPDSVDYLLAFSYKTTLEGQIKVFPADCLGYFTRKETIVRQMSVGSTTPVVWQGCNAGKRSFGLLHNGDVLGCTSIREKAFIEGNVRQRSLKDIWNDPRSFKWAREMKKSDLAGDCKTCRYGDICLGGCPNTRLTLNGSIYTENEYCAYHLAMHETRKTLANYHSAKELLDVTWSYVREQKWQLAALTLQRAHELDPQDPAVLELDGYVNFNLGNFSSAQKANEKILKNYPDNVYALKGLGLSLHKLGKSQEGIGYLKKAGQKSKSENMDAYYDLAIVYNDLGRVPEAIAALEVAEKKQQGFINRVYPFYQQLLKANTASPYPSERAPSSTVKS